MKKIRNYLTFATLLALLGVGTLTLGSRQGGAVKSEALRDLSYDKFVPIIADNFEAAGFSNVGENILTARATFWTDHYYGTSENVLDTVAIRGDIRGDFRTNWFKQTPSTADNKTYITFLLGGNTANNTFLNIWDENGLGNVYSGIKNDFFLDPGRALNMCFRYFEMPTNIDGERMLIYFNEDGGTSGCEGITFADLRINQSYEEVVDSYRNFLLGYKLASSYSSGNLEQYNAIMDLHNNNAYYAGLKASLEARETLTNVDDDFEVNDRLGDWVVDWNYTTTGFGLDSIYSNASHKVDGYFVNPMPFNQHGSYFLNEDANGFPESDKFRLVSREFELGGVGLVSAKLGGGTSVLQLLDADTLDVLASTDIHGDATGEYICNPAFSGGVGNNAHLDLAVSGARLNTLTRVYLDGHSFIGRKVRVALTDGRTGGGWGKAYFDDVKTLYTTYPALNVESLAQTVGDVTHYGVVTDKYVGSSSTPFGEAYNFLQSFYSTMRSTSNGVSWCSVKESTGVQNLLTTYDSLSDDAKDIVDASTDYDFGRTATSENWYLNAANFEYNVGSTIYAIKTGEYLSLSSVLVSGIVVNNKNALSVAIVVIISLAGLLTLLFMVKKKRRQ